MNINKYNYKNAKHGHKILSKLMYQFPNPVGITQKNLSNNPSQGIGLNPNLNI
jgi:hypothetical protein